MKLMDTFKQYHNELRMISTAGRIFNRIEATTQITGLTNIVHLSTLGNAVAEYVKQLLLFQNEPFEPATLDDIKKLHSEMEQCLRIFEGTPDENDSKFDARCILDLQILSELIDTDFRCNVSLKKRSQPVDFPRALIVFDLALSGVLHGMYRLVKPSSDTDESLYSMTAKLPTEKLITFELLDEQKYFNDEENAKILEAKEEREAAIREAAEQAKEEEEAKNYLENLDKLTYPNDEAMNVLKMSHMARIVTRAMKVWDTIDTLDGFNNAKWGTLSTIINNQLSYDIVGDGKFTYGDVACLSKVLNVMSKVPVRLTSFNLSSIIDKIDNDRPVPTDDLIDIVFEK